MQTLTPTRIPSLTPEPLRLAWQALGDLASQAAAAWLRYQERSATDHALRTLSPHLLRDIGLDPSEIPSIAIAVGNGGDPTRVRTTHPVRA